MKKLKLLLSLLSVSFALSLHAHGGRNISVHLNLQDDRDSNGMFLVTIKPVRSVNDLRELREDEDMTITEDQPQTVMVKKNKVRICVRYNNSEEGHSGGKSFVHTMDPSTTELHLNPKIDKKSGKTIVVDIKEAVTAPSSFIAMLLSYLS